MYQRRLFEVWGSANEHVAEQLLHAALCDHNTVPGQPDAPVTEIVTARRALGTVVRCVGASEIDVDLHGWGPPGGWVFQQGGSV